MQQDEPTAVYRLYDASGALLYVGATRQPEVRFGAHSLTQPWWPQVTRREVTWCATRIEAKGAEALAVRAENPRHNRRLRGDALNVTACTKFSEDEAARIAADRGNLSMSAWLRAAALAYLEPRRGQRKPPHPAPLKTREPSRKRSA